VESRVDPALSLVLREAVTNIIRHAGARHCRITLTGDGEWIRLVIRDDGRGGGYAEGSGMAGMRERVAAVGGTLELASENGTRLEISVPRRPAPEAGFERSGNVA
jgi:two-component system sensor histidine kinase DesK